MKQTKFAKALALSTGVLVFSISASYLIFAWNPPGETPPGNNAKAPINISGTAQGKLGNLGIGTESPTQKLDVRGSVSIGGNAGGNTNRLYLEPNDANHYIYSTGTTGNNMYFGEYNGNFHFINTNGGTEVATINSGNLGIGTAIPAQKLDVAGSVRASGELQSTMSTGYGQLRMVAGNYGAMLRNDGANTFFLLTNSENQYGAWNSLRPLYINNPTGNVYVGTKLCLGGQCCSTWEECMGGGGSPFIPVSGCTDPLPAGNKKIFVTSITYDVALVHAANFTYTTANADNACQARAAAAGLSGTYLALMYETVLSQLNNCNLITVLRYPTDVLPGAALWNGGKISGTNNCEWHLVATGANDMFSVNPDGNYLQNPIKYNEFGTLTDARVFTNFQPTGNGGYDRMNTCLQYSTCDYITGGAIRGCFYGYSTSKDLNWAGASSPLNGMGLCSTPCMDASSQKALYCVQQ